MLESIFTSEDFLGSCKSLIQVRGYAGKAGKVGIRYLSDSKCSMGHKGAYVSPYLNAGVFGCHSYFYYCSICDKVEIKSWGIDDKNESDIPGYWNNGDRLNGSPCPECKEETLFYINEWDPDPAPYLSFSFLVCINSSCNWPGEAIKNYFSED